MERLGKCPTNARGGWALLELTDALVRHTHDPVTYEVASIPGLTTTRLQCGAVSFTVFKKEASDNCIQFRALL